MWVKILAPVLASPSPRPRLVLSSPRPIALGALFLATGFNQPSIANTRTVDLLRLLGAGANLGAGLTLLVLHFVLRRQG
jgi:hypothetical protein